MIHKAILLIIILFTYRIGDAQISIKSADSIRKIYEIPEMAFAIITSDKIIQEVYLGYHKTDEFTNESIACQSDYFHLGSNTKAITGFIAAYLVEHHKIDWSTKIFESFPEWKAQSDTSYYNVTLQDLLSHRGRIQPYTSGLEYQELPDFKGSKAEQRQQFAAYVLKEKPVVNEKKVVYKYSNAGYSIAAAMLEKATGKTWEQLVDEIINDELNLKARFGWPNKISANEPWGHWIENNKLSAIPGNTSYNLNLAEPAGDISMTLPNYIKLIQLNLSGLSGTGNILKSSTYQFLHFGLNDYSIGWGNSVKENVRLSEHSGSAGTYFCYVLIDSVIHKAYIIMINSGTDKAQKGVFNLLAKLRSRQ